ncbi:MAG: hypothetical protein AAGG75_13320 [Bacteroidota bacterium]
MRGIDIIITVTNWQGYIMSLCCLLCFLYFSKLSAAQKILSYYLFFLLIMNTSMRLLSLERINNMAITHMISLGEFIFLSLFFRELLKGKFFLGKYFRFYLAIGGGLIIANTLFIEPLHTFNTNGKVLVLFIILFFATAFFYDRSQQLMEVDLHEKTTRLINSALLLYYSGSFFVYLFYKFTQRDEVFYSVEMMVFNAILYLIFTLLILMAILQVTLQGQKTVEG